MLGSNFQEGSSTSSRDRQQIQVADVEPGVLYAALRWVYTDRVAADMPAEQLLQVCLVLYVAGACRCFCWFTKVTSFGAVRIVKVLLMPVRNSTQ